MGDDSLESAAESDDSDDEDEELGTDASSCAEEAALSAEDELAED